MFRTAPFLFQSCRLWPHNRLLFELQQLCCQLRMLTRGIDLLFDCRYLHKICAALHTTWCGSAKLAFIFPDFSFVTGLVLCNSQRFFSVYSSSARLWQASEHKKEVSLLRYCDVHGLYHELSKYVSIKVPSARHSPITCLHATTHTVAVAGTCTLLILFMRKLSSTWVATAVRRVVWFSAWCRHRRRKWLQHFRCRATCSLDLNVNFNDLSLFFRTM